MNARTHTTGSALRGIGALMCRSAVLAPIAVVVAAATASPSPYRPGVHPIHGKSDEQRADLRTVRCITAAGVSFADVEPSPRCSGPGRQVVERVVHGTSDWRRCASTDSPHVWVYRGPEPFTLCAEDT
jgi:hypothetical protein